MQSSNPTPEPLDPPVKPFVEPPLNEGNDPKSGENNSPEAISGAVEGGWNGSVAGTNDALEPDAPTQTKR